MGLGQGYNGGCFNSNWGGNTTMKENKYQGGSQNGYAMAYSEDDCFSQIQYPSQRMSKTQTAYAMAETWDEYGQSYGSHKLQNGKAMAYSKGESFSQAQHPSQRGSKSQTAYEMAETWDEYGNGQSHGIHKLQNGNAMSKTQVHGHGNGYGSHSTNGIAKIQSHGSSNHGSPRKHEGHGYGYNGSPSRTQKISGGMDHGFSNHKKYEKTEGYGYGENNGCGKYKNNGMAQSQANLHGKHSGQGNGVIKKHSYGPGKNISYEISTETQTCEYSETRYSSESHHYGGARGRGGYRGGHNSCSDSESESECDEAYGMKKLWISKAI